MGISGGAAEVNDDVEDEEDGVVEELNEALKEVEELLVVR